MIDVVGGWGGENHSISTLVEVFLQVVSSTVLSGRFHDHIDPVGSELVGIEFFLQFVRCWWLFVHHAELLAD